MDEIYTIFRTIYFVWGVLLFFVMVYWGLQDLMLGKRCGHVQMPPEFYFFATAAMASAVVLALSLGEIFLQSIPGGYRVFLPALFLVPSSLGVHQGAFRIQMHRKSIEMGTCTEHTSKHHGHGGC